MMFGLHFAFLGKTINIMSHSLMRSLNILGSHCLSLKIGCLNHLRILKLILLTNTMLSLKNFRSDNGEEYTINVFKEHLAK